MDVPRVSLIIPVHNTASYLKRCVDSVRNQTLKEIEIILVDNLSTDGSAALCDEYARLDARIKVLHLSIADVSTARNEGIKVASAPYISFIDSDDYILPDMYRVLWTEITGQQAEIAYCNNFLEFEDGRIEAPYPDSGKTYCRTPYEVVLDIFSEKANNAVWGKLYRKEIFHQLLLPENMYLEDYATVYRWVAQCKKIVWIDQSYYYYIQRSNSIMHTLDLRKWYDFFKAEYLRLEFIKEHPLFQNREEVPVLVKEIAWKCNYKFIQCLKRASFLKDYRMIQDMRRDLYRINLLFPQIEISRRFRRRTWKMYRYWPVYYFFRYYHKDLEQESNYTLF